MVQPCKGRTLCLMPLTNLWHMGWWQKLLPMSLIWGFSSFKWVQQPSDLTSASCSWMTTCDISTWTVLRSHGQFPGPYPLLLWQCCHICQMNFLSPLACCSAGDVIWSWGADQRGSRIRMLPFISGSSVNFIFPMASILLKYSFKVLKMSSLLKFGCAFRVFFLNAVGKYSRE